MKQILYIGRIGTKHVLTVDKNVENKEAEITVGFDSTRKFYFHIDGKYPNPTNYNTIHLKEISIVGKKLIEMCEEIIDGKQSQVIL
jgi:hypothetical protein